MQFTRIRSEAGFSMISAIISLGALVVISLVVSESLSQLYKTSETRKKKNQAAILYTDIDTLMSDREICGQTFQGMIVGNGAVINTDLPVSAAIPNTSITIAQGQIIDEVYRVESANLRILGVNPLDVPVWNGASVMYHQYEGQLRIGLSVLQNDKAIALRPITMHMKILTNAAGAVTSCSNRSLEMANCASAGGIWDLTVTDETLRCAPNNHCRNMGTYTDGAPADLGFRNALTGGFNCPAGARRYIAGYVNGYTPTGKYSSNSQRYTIYNCVQCGPDAPTSTLGTAAAGVAFDFNADAAAAAGAVDSFCDSTECGGPPRGNCAQGEVWKCDPRASDTAPWVCKCEFRYTDMAVNPTATDPCKNSGQVWRWATSTPPPHWICAAPQTKTDAECYLEKYPDICINSPNVFCLNPLSHFNIHGKGEGRTWGCPPL